MALTTQDGLFSPNSQSSMTLGLNNANIYLGQLDARSQLNQLILKNFNFNFVGKGVMFIDPTRGIVLQTNTGIILLRLGKLQIVPMAMSILIVSPILLLV